MQVKTLGFVTALLAVGALITVLVTMENSGPAHGASLDGVEARGPSDGESDATLAEVALDDVERRPEEVAPRRSDVPEMGGTTRRAEATEVEPEPRVSDVTVHVVGRFVDGDASPLGGVELVSAESHARVESDSSGAVDLMFTHPIAEDTESLSFTASLAGYVTLELQPSIEVQDGRARIELGDVTLKGAGAVSGRVIDMNGDGVVGATVAVTGMGPLQWGSRGSGPFGRGPVSSRPSGVSTETLSEAGGVFRVEGVGAGEVRVWAGMEGWWWAHSDGVQVESGRETTDLELRLEPLEPEDVIELRVVDPDYEPVPRAKVSYHYSQDGSSGSGTVDTDENGVHRRILERRAAFNFCARDPEGKYRPAIARDVVPGTVDLVLVLGAPRPLSVRVRDTLDKSVGKFSVRSRSGTVKNRLSGESRIAEEEGQDTVVFQLPMEPFELIAEAEGYQSATEGPFDPERVGDWIDIELQPLPGIRGRVYSPEGTPVAGATVGLHSAVSENTWLTVNGFASRSEKGTTVRGTTDEEGRFSLTLRTKGQFYLRAEGSSGAAGEVGPLDLDGAVGANGIRVDLPEPGAIEGKLLMETGRDVAGLVIGISRADGHAVTGRTDEKGRFRFDDLTPGSWLVRRCNEEIRPGWTSSSSGSREESQELEWSCEVWPGRTTHFDLDLTRATRVTLEGRLLLGGAPVSGCKVDLYSVYAPDTVVASDNLDSQGEFLMELQEPETYSLRFTSFSGRGHRTLSQPVELALGRNEWSADPPVGTLEGNVAAHLVSGGQSVFVKWEGADGMRFTLFGNLEDDGSFVFEVPAGEVEVGYGEAETRTVVVPSGGLARVEIP